MTTGDRAFAIVRSPWTATLDKLLSEVQDDLLLVSPFIKLSRITEVISKLHRRGIDRGLKVAVLTNIHPESVLNGALDLEALQALADRIPQFALTHLPGLHAKVYVADLRMVVITSANLTDPGVSRNIEYGVACRDIAVISEVRRDFERYATLGASIPLGELPGLVADARELKTLYVRAQQTIQAPARRAFRRKLEAASVRVLQNRARGKTTQSLLIDTILFLLERGPMTTADLQPLVQQLQPDLCDDSVDRVIDDVHFGKKWKHHVRSAQQALKRSGQIRFDGTHWHLTASPMSSPR
jgi:hypothetical protein